MKDKIPKTGSSDTSEPGVFITKGMRVSIPSFSLHINDDGSIESDPVELHTGLDICPFWIEIALDHLEDSDIASEQLSRARSIQDDKAIAEALRNDFISGMQTIMACAIALDAFYANIKERAQLPSELTEVWRKNGTARYKQIAEVFRIAFKLKQTPVKNIRTILKQIFNFRDKAVHPSSKITAPEFHPKLNKATDSRYVIFRNENARIAVKLTLSIIDQTINKTQKSNEQLNSYSLVLAGAIGPLVERWEKRYGSLYEEKGDM